MLSHVSDGSASDPEVVDQTHDHAWEESDENAAAGDSTAMTATSQPTTASHVRPGDKGRCDEVSGFQTNIDAEQLLPSDLYDAVPTGEDHDAGACSFSSNPVLQARQDPTEMDFSRLLGGVSEIRSLPDVWTHEYQMGVASFQARSPSADRITRGLGNTNSSFSDHMEMIRGCLNIQWQRATQAWTNIEASQVSS